MAIDARIPLAAGQIESPLLGLARGIQQGQQMSAKAQEMKLRQQEAEAGMAAKAQAMKLRQQEVDSAEAARQRQMQQAELAQRRQAILGGVNALEQIQVMGPDGQLDMDATIAQRRAALPQIAAGLQQNYGLAIPDEELSSFDVGPQGLSALRNSLGAKPEEIKVGRYREIKLPDGSTATLDTATNAVTTIQKAKGMDLSILPQEMQESVSKQPIDVQKDIVKKYATPKQTESVKDKETQQAAKISDATAAISNIDFLLGGDNYKSIYGSFQGSVLSPTIMQSSVDAEAKRDQIVNLLSIDSREKLKGQGTITDQESEALSKSATILQNPRISDEAAAAELKRVREVFNAAIKRSGGTPIEFPGNGDEGQTVGRFRVRVRGQR